jgi:hypothetical protein
MMSQLRLARCTKTELHALLNLILSELPYLAEGSADLLAARANLQIIRRMIVRPEFEDERLFGERRTEERREVKEQDDMDAALQELQAGQAKVIEFHQRLDRYDCRRHHG